jgi:hypothetical protein
MSSPETHAPKEVTLHTLKIQRFFYLFAAILSSSATLIVLVCTDASSGAAVAEGVVDV